MYPLPIVLLGIDEGLLPSLRRELWNGSATVESEFQSAYMAIDCLRHYKNQPRLLIVQTGADFQPDSIQRLAATLKGWPILALVSSTDGEDFLRVNRAGAVQVLALPLDSADFQQALGVIGSQFDRGSLDRQVFGVTSATGGSGATTIAANLAYEIAEQVGRRTVLAELTQQMGSLASMFDLEPRVTLPHLIREIHRVDDYLVEKTLVPFTDKLKILAGPDELNSMRSAEPEELVKIVECLRKLADVTVLDMPGTFDELEFQVLRACEKVIVVGTQSVRSLKSLRLFCESLPEERLVHSLWVVLNRYNAGMKGFTCDEIKDMLGVARVLTVADDTQAVNLSINKGRPLRQVSPGTPILHDLDALVTTSWAWIAVRRESTGAASSGECCTRSRAENVEPMGVPASRQHLGEARIDKALLFAIQYQRIHTFISWLTRFYIVSSAIRDFPGFTRSLKA
jgi:pilus assembly protein CpaE